MQYPRLEMTSTSFAVQAAPGIRMVVYTPADASTRAALAQLIGIDPADHHFPCWQDHQVRRQDLASQPVLPGFYRDGVDKKLQS